MNRSAFVLVRIALVLGLNVLGALASPAIAAEVHPPCPCIAEAPRGHRLT